MEHFEDLPWTWHKSHTDEELDILYTGYFDNRYDDPFYCWLHGIEYSLVKNPLSLSSDESGCNDGDDSDTDRTLDDFKYIDPRTDKYVKQLYINHSESTLQIQPIKKIIPNQNKSKEFNKIVEIFNEFPNKSTVFKKEQISCLHILSKKQLSNLGRKFNNITKETEKIFNNTITKRNHEYKLFNEFIQKYLSNKNNESRQILHDLYKFYLDLKIREILENTNYYFQLQSALPFNCTLNNCDDNIIFKCNQIIETFGKIQLIENNELEFISNINYCCEIYQDIISKDKYSIISEYNELKIKSIAFQKNIDIIMSEIVLSFLLCCQEFNSEESWEIPFVIEKNYESCYDNDDFNTKKIIKFDEILPSKLFTIQNEKFIYEQLFEISMEKRKEIFHKSKSEKELHAINLDKDYKLINFEKYLENIYEKNLEYKKQFEETEQKIEKEKEKQSKNKNKDNSIYPKTNFNLIEWSLEKLNDKCFKILTKTRLATLKNNPSGLKEMINYSFKVEHKKEFGAEVMTKIELIQEWIRQFLMPGSFTMRYRIDVESINESILCEKLSQQNIESDLLRLWNTKPNQLMSELYNILTLLQNFPDGDYMLKYSSNHKDRILVYMRNDEKRSDNDINLHDFYSEEILKDFNIKRDNNFIPIDNLIITPLHLRYRILPCCFPYWGNGKQDKINNNIDDRDKLLNKCDKEMKKILKEKIKQSKKISRKRKQVKRLKRAQKLKNLKKVQEKQENKFEEMEF